MDKLKLSFYCWVLRKIICDDDVKMTYRDLLGVYHIIQNIENKKIIKTKGE